MKNTKTENAVVGKTADSVVVMPTKKAVKVGISKGLLIKKFLETKGTTFIGMTATTECRMNKGGRSGVAVNRLHGKVVKKSKVGSIVGADYTNMVNNAKIREAKADAKDIVFKFADDIRESMLLFGITEQEISDYENAMTDDIRQKAIKNIENGDIVTGFVAGKRAWGNYVQIGVEFNPETLENEPIFSKIVIEYEKDGEHRFYLQVFVLSTRKPTYHYADSGEELSETDLEYIRQYFPAKSDGKNQGLKSPIIVRDYRVDNLDTMRVNKTDYVIE